MHFPAQKKHLLPTQPEQSQTVFCRIPYKACTAERVGLVAAKGKTFQQKALKMTNTSFMMQPTQVFLKMLQQ